MIKFIELTESVRQGTVTVPVLINPAHIASIKIGLQGRDTHIGMSDGKFFFVKESVSEVKRILSL